VMLKTRTVRNFCVEGLGWTHWTNIVGLRYDEGMRVMKALARNDSGKDRFRAAMPLSKAKATRRDVLSFWGTQPFDLGLSDYEGNCDLCFLKSRGKLKRLIRDHPRMAEWWKAREVQTAQTARNPNGARWREDEPYADLEREVRTQPFMPGLLDDEEYDAECGLTCAGEAALTPRSHGFSGESVPQMERA
jgi:hypothetical protein